MKNYFEKYYQWIDTITKMYNEDYDFESERIDGAYK